MLILVVYVHCVRTLCTLCTYATRISSRTSCDIGCSGGIIVKLRCLKYYKVWVSETLPSCRYNRVCMWFNSNTIIHNVI